MQLMGATRPESPQASPGYPRGCARRIPARGAAVVRRARCDATREPRRVRPAGTSLASARSHPTSATRAPPAPARQAPRRASRPIRRHRPESTSHLPASKARRRAMRSQRRPSFAPDRATNVAKVKEQQPVECGRLPHLGQAEEDTCDLPATCIAAEVPSVRIRLLRREVDLAPYGLSVDEPQCPVNAIRFDMTYDDGGSLIGRDDVVRN